MPETTEFEALLSSARNGDEDAAWQIVGEYGPHIVAVVRRRLGRRIRTRLDSHDLVQAVWKSFFFDMAGVEQIQTPKQLVAVLAKMTENKVVDAYRRHLGAERRGLGREKSIQEATDDGQALSSNAPTPSQFAMARERWTAMLQHKSRTHQRIINLRLAGETFDGIAEQVGVSERTARRVIDDLWAEHSSDEA